MLTFKYSASCALLAASLAGQSYAADWSTNELQYQYGNLVKAFQGGGNDAETGGTSIVTLQHASGWQYGDTFFFFDFINYGQTDAEDAAGTDSDDELYGELYTNFSLSKITGKTIGAGPVKDIGLIAGFNFAAEVDTVYYLPGVRVALDLPGFAFANIDITAYIQDVPSNAGGGVNIEEDDSFMIDFNFAYPFNIGKTSWSLEGHIEYIDGADTKIHTPGGTFEGERESWVLAQPQLRLDVGELFGMAPQQLFGGIEYQYWQNKLGDKDTDEKVAQLLVVWRL